MNKQSFTWDVKQSTSKLSSYSNSIAFSDEDSTAVSFFTNDGIERWPIDKLGANIVFGILILMIPSTVR